MTPESRIVLPAEWRWMSWRNGGGRTAEIHVGGDAAVPDWRLSLAIIERDGPFSAWPGMDRTLVWLDGGRLELDVNGERRSLDGLGARTGFRGEDSVEGRVVRRTTVLNLMVRRAAEAGATTWIVHASRDASIRMDGRRVELPAQATLIARAAAAPVADAGAPIILEVAA